MAEITGGLLKNVEGHIADMTIYKRGGKTFMRPTHIRQPRRLSHSKSGTLALVGDLFADPMLGFALVRFQDGHVPPQFVVTRCTYYERYTTEEALQTAAESYKGLTGE